MTNAPISTFWSQQLAVQIGCCFLLLFKPLFYALWFKVHIFWEGHKILQNLHRRFDWHYIGQINSGDFAKIFVALLEYMNFT